MTVDSISFIPLISAICVFGFGLIVFFKNYHLKLNRIFFLMSLAITTWLFGTFMMFNSTTGSQAIFWDRSIYAGVVFIPALIYHFSSIFTHKKRNKYLLTTGYLLSFIFLILSRTDYFVNDLFRYRWGVHAQARIFHHVFLVFFIVFTIFTLRNFYRYYKNESLNSLEKMRAKYVFAAFFILLTVGSTAYTPAYKIGIFPFSFLSGLFFIAILTYAILKYRLMNIRFALLKGAVYGFSILAVVGLAFLITVIGDHFLDGISANILIISTVLVTVVVFQAILSFFRKISGKFFEKSYYNHREVLDELGKKLTKILDMDELCSLINDTLIEVLNLNRAVILIRDEETGEYNIEKNVGFKEENGISLVRDNFLTDYLKEKEDILIYEELSLIKKDAQIKEKEKSIENLQRNMERIEAQVCVPLLAEDKIIGIIVLGDKVSGAPYFRQDINLLKGLITQASFSIRNAKLYSEVDDLSQNLEKKVKKKTKELRDAYEKLKASDRAKSEFINMASHQLRTPLTPLKGYVSMLKSGNYGELPSEALDKLDILSESVERLISLVDKLLNLSRIDLGKLSADPEKINLVEIAESSFEEMKIEGESENLSMQFESPVEDIILEVDPEQVKEIVSELINNAVKYTKKGSITVGVTDEKTKAVIYVSDTGEGFSEEEKQKAFDRFTRGEAGLTHYTEGTGLGLHLCAKYAKINGGKIRVESEGKGRGSTFYIELEK